MGLSCSSCGYRSQNRAFFRRAKGGSFALDRWFCLGCKPFPKARLSFTAIVASGFLALFGWLAVAVNEGLEPFGYLMMAWGGFISLTPFTLAVHEMGHAAVAALLGRRVYQINIGSGAPFKTFRIGRTLLVLGRDMSAGYVVQLPLQKASRWGDMAILAAGAVANLIAAVSLMFLADYLSAWSGVAAAFTAGSILSNLLTGLGALIPKSHVREGQLRPSDGQQMLQLLRRQRAKVDWQVHHDAFKGGELLEAKLWEEAEAHYRDAFVRHPDQPGFLGVLMHVLAISKGYEAAMYCAKEHDAFLRQERQILEPMAPLWSYAWSMAAWAFIRSPTGDFTSADTLSRKALQAGSSPYPRAVQGAILTRVGEQERGLSEILDSLRELGSPSDKLEFCDFIISEHLESVDLKASDFRSYAAHLRALI